MTLTYSLTEIDAIARKIIAENPQAVILFNGQMGSGKTTLIKAITRALGVEETVSSPTFSLINEYKTASGDRIYHFDAYRLKDETEAYAIGMDEYLYSGEWCFVEWAEKVRGLIPEAHSVIDISLAEGGNRRLSLY